MTKLMLKLRKADREARNLIILSKTCSKGKNEGLTVKSFGKTMENSKDKNSVKQ